MARQVSAAPGVLLSRIFFSKIENLSEDRQILTASIYKKHYDMHVKVVMEFVKSLCENRNVLSFTVTSILV